MTRHYLTPEDHQPHPGRLTEPYLTAQVQHWEAHGDLVHPDVARAIAALWQSPGWEGRSLAAFASSGELGITSPDLDLVREIRAQLTTYRPETDEALMLRALLAYVEEAVWINTQYRLHVDSSGWHHFMHTDTIDHEACLRCGAEYLLIPSEDAPHIGRYVDGRGEPLAPCPGAESGIVHGYERICEVRDGRPCDANETSGRCPHVDHDCTCLRCY